MTLILIFRIIMLSSFVISALFLGDWKNRNKYYPTVLFIMIINITVSFLTYHHVLWSFNPDALVKTYTTVEILNSYIVLPCTTFVFLSKLPRNSGGQLSYIGLWILIYSTIEFIDKTIGGISYQHGWSWQASVMFDCAMFSILRIHYLRPFAAWVMTFLLGFLLIIEFNFISGQFK